MQDQPAALHSDLFNLCICGVSAPREELSSGALAADDSSMQLIFLTPHDLAAFGTSCRAVAE